MSIYTITLPDLGEGVVEGEVLEWRKNIGDSVAKDETVVLVMTDKATVELPSPYEGKLIQRHYKVGEIVLVGKPLYEIESQVHSQEISPKKIEEKEQEYPQTTVSFKTQNTKKIQATPSTRKLAKDLGIDIDQIVGTGKEGRVTDLDLVNAHSKSDVKKSKLEPINYSPDDEIQPLKGIRRIIADKMMLSKSTIPHFSYFDQFNATELNKTKKSGEIEGRKMTYMPFFIRALSLALKKYPQFNSSFDKKQDALIIHRSHHIGIATKTELGLVVSVLKDVQKMSFDQIVYSYNTLLTRAKQGKLERSELQGSTITITNFSSLGGLWATPIINYPEVAILGIAKIRKQPVVVNEEIIAQDIGNLSWSFDHRVIDGDLAAAFSNYYISLLENPSHILLN